MQSFIRCVAVSALIALGCVGLSYGQTTVSSITTTGSSSGSGTPFCAYRYLHIKLNNNQSTYVNALVAQTSTWDAASQQKFAPYLAKIQTAVHSAKPLKKIFKKVIKQTKKFAKKNKASKSAFYAINIPEWHGTVKQFVKCGAQV